MQEYTVKEIADLKECSVDEILAYLKNHHAYIITKSDNDILTPSEIKLIDPVLFYKLQHRTSTTEGKRVKERSDSYEKSSKRLRVLDKIDFSQLNAIHSDKVSTPSEELQDRQGMKLAEAGKFFHTPWSRITEILNQHNCPIALHPNARLSDEQYDILKSEIKEDKAKLAFPFDDILLRTDEPIEYVGSVIFYDSRKNNFGFVGTNKLCSANNIRIEYCDIEGREPEDEDVVLFLYQNKKISNVRVINSNTKVNWRHILRYTGNHYSIIHCSTNKGEDRSIYDVFGRVMNLTHGEGLWDTLVNILKEMDNNPSRREEFIAHCIEDSHLEAFMSKQRITDENQPICNLWQEAIAKKALAKKDYDKYLHLLEYNSNLPYPENPDDELRCAIYAQTGDKQCLDGIIDKERRDELIATALLKKDSDIQQERLLLLTSAARKRIVLNYMKGTDAYITMLREEWEAEKAKMPYVVFDLETDPDDKSKIKEFAFISEDNVKHYTGEAQLKSLVRALNKTPIVVGHNIRVWDLPILKEKGFETEAFIWDTLEMEILLNPCRYAYSLHTTHLAQEDTALTNDLFWNQLFRIAQDDNLRKELKNYLPKEIDDILRSLQNPEFIELFQTDSKQDVRFFQELIKLDEEVQNRLSQINEETDRTLIIAPRDLWARIAQYVHVSFPGQKDDRSFNALDFSLISKEKELTDYQKCILKRFIDVSATPLIANIAPYIKIDSEQKGNAQISPTILHKCAVAPISNIECVDVESFDNIGIIETNYHKIYVIGEDLQDRTHKCQLGEPYSFADLLNLHSKLPLAMAASNYCRVDDIELGKLGLHKPTETANIWAERTSSGEVVVYYNFEYQIYRRDFLSHYDVTPIDIEWKFEDSEINKENIVFVGTDQTQEYNSALCRLSPKTTQRSKYWLYQFGLVKQIHSRNANTPIILVTNDLNELEVLTSYASSLGFTIPQTGTVFRKLEYIQNYSNGLLVISKDDFINHIGEYRTDGAYCYIWDNMDIDRYKLMWRKLPFKTDIEDTDNAELDEHGIGTTSKQCILAEWPLFEHYYSLISANHRESKFYIIEPSIDEYNDIAELCDCSYMAAQIWENAEAYTSALDNARTYFNDGKEDDFIINSAEAMNVIKDMFIEGHDWHDYQTEILPYILEKKGDCLISIPTGGGKSVLFQGPAIYRSAYTHKLSIVITPLKALMQDQVEDLAKKGFGMCVDYLSGDRLYPETQQIYRRIASGEIALLYVTPERFRVRSFIEVLQQRLEMDNGLEYFVFDEAHCISQWGQDFRPDYRNVMLKCVELQKQHPFTITFFSATVTTQVEDDIRRYVGDIERLGQSPEDYNPIRDHIGINFLQSDIISDALTF